jgi:hypothetical protein
MEVAMKEKTFSAEDTSVIFDALLCLREALNIDTNNTIFGVHVRGLEYLMKSGGTEEEIAEFRKVTRLTACNEQRHWHNRYQYHTTQALIEEHLNKPDRGIRERAIAKEARAKFDALDEQAQAEDDARCAEAEAREVERFEQYYR